MMIGESTGVTARQHGGDELDTDDQTDDKVAEIKLLMDEKRKNRQWQTDR
jgi:hypothetical protein